jgi:CPA2 family monovalent cation:H+ antiporter-2
VAISDPAATRRITEIARELNPHIYIIVRTRYFQELEALRKLGADEVIPEEFETSVEIFTRVLKKYLVPGYEIEKFVADVRSGEYEMLRSLSSKRSVSFSDFRLHLPDIEITSFRIGEKSPAAGSSLAQIDLRKRYGVSMLVIRRGSELIVNPHGETPLYAGDIVVVVGTRDKIAEAIILFLGQEA